MKQVLLISTGGTIGSTVQAGTIDTHNSAQLKLVQLFQQQDASADIAFHCRQPLHLLSENLSPCVWQTLIAAIEAENLDDYDGIIITHGTDTLAYTSAALSFYFHALKIPMLLVSSDYPLDDTRANGLNNFICAVEFIRQQKLAGVFVPYQNQGQEMLVHLGSRLTCSLQLGSDFFSVQNKPFMVFLNKQFISYFEIKQSKLTLPLQPIFNAHILLIKPYPGLDYQFFDLNSVDVVLHDLYHSGTACVISDWGENYSLIQFLHRCQSQRIPVYLAPAIYSDTAYQSTRTLIEQGAKILWNMSLEAAYVKLLLAYGSFLDDKQRIDFIEQDVNNEHI